MSSSPEVFEFGQLAPVAPAVAHANAQGRLEALAAAAESRGYEEGYAAGLAEARARLEPALSALAEAVQGVERSQEAFLERAERSAVDLAFQIAEKVVGAAVANEPGAVLEVVAGVLRRTMSRDALVLEVNPVDLDVVREGAGEIASRLGGFGRLEVVAERRVARGGCVVRTEEGEVDARIEEQLLRLREVLEGATPARVDG